MTAPRPALTLLVLGVLTILSAASPALAQQTLLIERFDSATPPTLPAGWVSSGVRDPDGDFTLTASGAFSQPGCVVGTNATVRQSLTSPPIDLRDRREAVLGWMERRSATHDASMVVEASVDGGIVFTPLPADTIRPPGGTSFVERRVSLPDPPGGEPAVSIRWTVVGDGAGATGTIRLDDISLSARVRLDLALPPGWISPPGPGAGDEVRFGGHVVNRGYGEAAGARVWWANDADGDGRPGDAEAGGWTDPGTIAPGDSAAWEFSFPRPGPGPVTLLAIVALDSDMARANDTAVFHLPAAPGSVVINEIMYDPLPGRAEYVELFNRTSEPVNIAGWRLTDREDDSTAGDLGAGVILIGAGGYLLCSPDTGVRPGYPGIPEESPLIERMRGFTLNNDGDRLLLYDGSGGAIDRVEYDPAWHTPALDVTQGRSLERIESVLDGEGPWNWGTSAGTSGGTPGRRNSLAADTPGGGALLSCAPNPFSPDGDGFEDVTVVVFRAGATGVIARVRIYDAEGRRVRTLTGSEYVSGTASFAWNGYDESGRRVPIGIYVVLLDAVDSSGTGAFTAKGVVVVAGRL